MKKVWGIGVVLAGDFKVFMLGGIDIRLTSSIMLIFASLMALRSALKEKSVESQDAGNVPH